MDSCLTLLAKALQQWPYLRLFQRRCHAGSQAPNNCLQWIIQLLTRITAWCSLSSNWISWGKGSLAQDLKEEDRLCLSRTWLNQNFPSLSKSDVYHVLLAPLKFDKSPWDQLLAFGLPSSPGLSLPLKSLTKLVSYLNQNYLISLFPPI